MRDFRSVITSAFLAFAAWTATVNPSQADTGTVRILFGAAGIIAGVGNGNGTLTFHGRTYPFEVSAASFGATLALTVSELNGRALNLRTPGDLAGNYIAIGAGGAIAGGIGVARLRNANGVTLAGCGALGQLSSRHHYNDVTTPEIGSIPEVSTCRLVYRAIVLKWFLPYP